MRLATLVFAVLALAALAVAAYAGNPLWRHGLYASVFLATLFALSLLAAILESTLEVQRFWGFAGLAVLIGGLALFESRTTPPGQLPELPLSHLWTAGISVASLAAILASGVLAWLVLRTRERKAHALAALALLLDLLALGPWLIRLR